jgi:hypothetical protein
MSVPASQPPADPGPAIPIIATVFWGIGLLPGLIGALLSPMMFDAPGSMNNPVAWIDAGIVVSFPLLCIVSIASVWILYARHKRRPTKATSTGQLVAAGLPFLPILYFVVVMLAGMIWLVLTGQTGGLHETVISH